MQLGRLFGLVANLHWLFALRAANALMMSPYEKKTNCWRATGAAGNPPGFVATLGFEEVPTTFELLLQMYQYNRVTGAPTSIHGATSNKSLRKDSYCCLALLKHRGTSDRCFFQFLSLHESPATHGRSICVVCSCARTHRAPQSHTLVRRYHVHREGRNIMKLVKEEFDMLPAETLGCSAGKLFGTVISAIPRFAAPLHRDPTNAVVEKW